MTTTTSPGLESSLDDARSVLAALRASRHREIVEQAEQLRLAVAWAAMHSVDSIAEAACHAETWFDDKPVPIAGQGAPLVASFSIAEFAVTLGLATPAGEAYLGEAVELCHRLPRVWKRVMGYDLPAWKARRIARKTLDLSLEAAGFVDRQIAPVAHRVSLAALDRLIDEARTRFDPTEAEAIAQAALDRRHVRVHRNLVSFAGTLPVTAEVDVADGLDLENAVAAGAQLLKDLGSTESLDARRARALGMLARGELTLKGVSDSLCKGSVHQRGT